MNEENKDTPSVIGQVTASALVSTFNSPTLHASIEPLLAMQTTLNGMVRGLSPTLTAMDRAYASLSPVLESTRVLGSSLAEISKVATSASLLFKVPSYDFLNEPILSGVSSAVDLLKRNQSELFSYVSQFENISGPGRFSIPDHISEISSLSGVALDYLQASPSLYPSLVFTPGVSEVDSLKQRVENLESKVKELEDENRVIRLTGITNKVSEHLEKIDIELARIFRGAISTLTADQSEDLVGQVAESLTRVVAELPFKLGKVKIVLGQNKEILIIEALGSYLQIPEGNREEHHLILQQNNFYTTLSKIRHRNPAVYSIYNSDRSRFKALVTQVEAYIYILVTFKV